MLTTPKRELLILRRKQSPMSQIAVAAQLGISQAQYSTYENGYRTPTGETAEKLIAMFHLPSDYFDETQQEGA